MIDLHVHTRFSFDSDEQPENYIRRAGELNAKMLGFSEHYDYDALLDGADISVADIPEYVEYIKALKNRCYKPEILCGIEFGYRDFAVDKYRSLISEYDFDYVINSVHTLPGRGDCFHDKFFENKTLKESYYDYFKAVLESVRADFDYQIVGHIGYVSRYRHGDGSKIRYADFAEIIDDILREIVSRDKCLEINTSSGHDDVLCLPDTDIIKRYLELGGKKMSFGSDAHSVERFMSKSDKLKEFLKSAGVGELYYYRERKPIAYKI